MNKKEGRVKEKEVEWDGLEVKSPRDNFQIHFPFDILAVPLPWSRLRDETGKEKWDGKRRVTTIHSTLNERRMDWW